ncbi:Arc family DNA-binding protein [Moraxella bovis]|uniref:Arc family DNA-binding protein n=1 Tax=Moraxella bovis TaxID=476 RepID=UPI000992EB21|nr:Arc family DNA-binding protein [Moraxella bovis]OOR87026.1 hypothetical protein B0182_13390 [Moraxella bovis]UZA15757.1 Arc family DNA-binding protein [Moraxella bovis]
MSRDIAPFGVRMPSELKEYLTQKASDNKRSLNAEIVARLEVTMQQDELHTGGFTHFIDEYLDLMADKESLKRENESLKAGFPPQPPIQKTVSQESIDYLYERLKTLIESKNSP